jgi:hypothetical protein
MYSSASLRNCKFATRLLLGALSFCCGAATSCTYKMMHDAEQNVRVKSSAMESSNPLLYSDFVLQNVLAMLALGTICL